MMRQAITDESILIEIGTGWPWKTVDDTYCVPDGAFRQHVESMVRRGVLNDDGQMIRPSPVRG